MCSYSRVWVEKKKVKWSNTDYKRCTDDTVDRKLFDPEKWFDGTKFGLKNEDTEKNDQIRWRGGGLRIAAAPTTPSVANWISRINKKFPHFSSPCAISRFLPVGINWPADPPPLRRYQFAVALTSALINVCIVLAHICRMISV